MCAIKNNFEIYFHKLGSLETLTSSFDDKTDVAPNHWKTHIVEERPNITSELACMGLAHFEEWHYSVFDASGTCNLGLISNDSTLNPGPSLAWAQLQLDIQILDI